VYISDRIHLFYLTSRSAKNIIFMTHLLPAEVSYGGREGEGGLIPTFITALVTTRFMDPAMCLFEKKWV